MSGFFERAGFLLGPLTSTRGLGRTAESISAVFTVVQSVVTFTAQYPVPDIYTYTAPPKDEGQ